MKKFLMSVLSLALVVFTGFAVGCSAQALDTIPVKIQVNGTERSESTTDNITTYTFTTTEERLAEGIDIVIDADTAKGKSEDYTIKITGDESLAAEVTGRHYKIEDVTTPVELTVEIKISDEGNKADEKGNVYFKNTTHTFKIKLVKKATTNEVE